MKYIFSFLIILLFNAVACITPDSKSQEEKNSILSDKRKLDSVLTLQEAPSQFINTSAQKPTTIIGRKGTILYINPEDLVTGDGSPLGSEIRVELKELTNQRDLLKARAQTTSNGRLLVSGGAYYINLTSNGQQLNLKEGKSLGVQFRKNSNQEMGLFYGQRDSLGKMNWLPTGQSLVRLPQTDTTGHSTVNDGYNGEIDQIIDYLNETSGEDSLSDEDKKRIENWKRTNKTQYELYEKVNLTQLGWINCDRFYEDENLTNLKFAFSNSDSVTSGMAYLVFKDINSIMESRYMDIGQLKGEGSFNDIPVGEKVQLIVVAIKGEKMYSHVNNITIKANETVPAVLRETKVSEIANLFSVK